MVNSVTTNHSNRNCPLRCCHIRCVNGKPSLPEKSTFSNFKQWSNNWRDQAQCEMTIKDISLNGRPSNFFPSLGLMTFSIYLQFHSYPAFPSRIRNMMLANPYFSISYSRENMPNTVLLSLKLHFQTYLMRNFLCLSNPVSDEWWYRSLRPRIHQHPGRKA